MPCSSMVAFIVTLLIFATSNALPLCGKGGDTFGQWVNTADIESMPNSADYGKEHFIGGGLGEARNFTRVWVPDACAVHRFTAESVQAMVSSILIKRNQTEPLRVIILGDSGTRGVFCGITRILSGSEVVGPCINAVCGTEGTIPMSHKRTHSLEDVSFGPNLTFSFMYIKTLTDKYPNWMVESSIDKKPFAVVVNTGAWDFDHVARLGAKATPECGPEQTEEHRIASVRVAPAIVAFMKENGKLAQERGVRAIYRNNHYNYRFGALCADALVEAAIQDTPWEIWDNRRMSKDVWEKETYDGFHFDRHRIHTVAHHKQLIELNREMNKDVPGALEIQFAQSLLFLLFHDEVQEYADKHP